MGLLYRVRLVELRGQSFAGRLPEGVLDEPAGVLTGWTGKSCGLDGGLALWADDDFDLAASGSFRFEDVYQGFIENINAAMGTRMPNQPSEPTRAARGSS